jgi:ABC-2 type transport system ATP-binding protein
MVPALSGRRNLKMLARLHHDVNDMRVEEILDYVGLSEAADRKYKGYSLGMRQRLGLAAALLHRPALLILDEPTNGLDPAGMREMRDLLRGLAGDGTTVFLSSHLLHEVEQVCDRVAVLNQGRVVAEGLVRELLRGSRVVRARVPSTTAAVAALEGLPGMTCVEANGHSVVVHGVGSEAVIVRLVEKGVVPSEVTTGETDLESVFLSLTQAAA